MVRDSSTRRRGANAFGALWAAALIAGCAASTAPRSVAPPATPKSEREIVQPGRIVLRGDVAPEEYGPLKLDGRYRVRFTQRGSGVDFGAEVPFTAHAEAVGTATAPRVLRLFENAARTGTTTVTARGRWRIEVDFGDSPFELSLTHLPGA